MSFAPEAVASSALSVVRQERMYPPVVAPLPQTLAAATSAVVLPLDDWPNRCTQPLSWPSRSRMGPAKAVEIAKMGIS